MKVSFGEAENDGRGHVVIQMTRTYDNGFEDVGVFIMPEDTLEWRAAEYGIDPTDLDTLMDVVLTEQFLDVSPYEVPPLFSADTVDEARKVHLTRCTEAKLKHRISTRGKNHPLTALKPQMMMDDEALEIKRAVVAQRRRQFSHVRAATARDDRLEKLRQMIHPEED